ncbi:tRNA pseudouridine(55) synthase TruB, partial [Buchnera aphidicola (Hormaphis cornu)]
MQGYSKSRNVDGFLLLDKPYNISSNTALQKVKKIFNARKAGHAGSLDPIATGMLLVCFGEATKFVKYLINLDKRYQVILKLGESTSTFDSEGELLKSSIVDCSYTKIIKVLKKFIGKTYQIPPLY